MSDEEKGYVPYRVSMKQEKLYKAMSEIRKLNEHKRKPQIVGIPKLEHMRGLKEIVSGLAIPKKEKW